MLQAIRDGLQSRKWLTYVVLGALALVFAAWGAYGLVNLNAGATTYAAEADGQKVSVESARNAWLQEQSQYQQRLGGEIPPAQKALLQDRLLETMIRETLLTARAHDLGYRVSENDVLQAIREEPAFQVNGQFNSQVARDRLAQAGITLDAFETELRGALQRAQLQNGIALSDFQTPAEVQRARALQDEEREVQYVLLPPEKYSLDAPVDDAAVEAYYKAHQSQYMIPERANLQYAQLRLEQLAAQITPSDAELKAAYEKNKDRYVEAEKRRARHILIPVGKDDAAARKQAEDVLTQAKGGKDFAALAKQYSQDPGSAQQGGDLGWADRNQFVGPFGDALFSMSPGELRGPVKTQFGYHIIRLDEVQPSKGKSFEEVRGDLEAELKRNAAADRFGEIQEKLQARVEQPNADLDALAKEFKLETGDVPKFLQGAGGAPLGAAKPVQDLVFGENPLAVGRLGGPVLVGDDRLVLVKVVSRDKAQPQPLAEVRDSIVAAIRKERGSQAALQAAQQAQGKLAGGESFDSVAKGLGVTASPLRFIGRTDPSIPAALREAAFNSAKPEGKAVYKAMVLPTGGAAVLAITMVRTEPADVPKEQQASRVQQQVMQAKQDAMRHGQEDALIYAEEVRRDAKVRKNLKVFE
ncbi:MAG: peptidyl-prolyl cis-trans isomerase [Sinobacteraceae bacterium]|nr:peptidyl-prolyl cis-trans isomerase [Nevskiaceae bacterium]